MKQEEVASINMSGVVIISVGAFFKIHGGPDHIKAYLTSPLMTTNGKTVGERNTEYLHEMLDKFIRLHCKTK